MESGPQSEKIVRGEERSSGISSVLMHGDRDVGLQVSECMEREPERWYVAASLAVLAPCEKGQPINAEMGGECLRMQETSN